MTRENPVEVVIMLDVFNSDAVSNNSLYRELVNGVSTVLRSLNTGDRVRRETGRRGRGGRGKRGREREREREKENCEFC